MIREPDEVALLERDWREGLLIPGTELRKDAIRSSYSIHPPRLLDGSTWEEFQPTLVLDAQQAL